MLNVVNHCQSLFSRQQLCLCNRSEELRKQFDELDHDGSGSLSADEVCKSIAVECALDDFMARAIVDDFDLNKDGKVSKADLNDLCLKMFG